jgi:hypothetical protein
MKIAALLVLCFAFAASETCNQVNSDSDSTCTTRESWSECDCIYASKSHPRCTSSWSYLCALDNPCLPTDTHCITVYERFCCVMYHPSCRKNDSTVIPLCFESCQAAMIAVGETVTNCYIYMGHGSVTDTQPCVSIPDFYNDAYCDGTGVATTANTNIAMLLLVVLIIQLGVL